MRCGGSILVKQQENFNNETKQKNRSPVAKTILHMSASIWIHIHTYPGSWHEGCSSSVPHVSITKTSNGLYYRKTKNLPILLWSTSRRNRRWKTSFISEDIVKTLSAGKDLWPRIIFGGQGPTSRIVLNLERILPSDSQKSPQNIRSKKNVRGISLFPLVSWQCPWKEDGDFRRHLELQRGDSVMGCWGRTQTATSLLGKFHHCLFHVTTYFCMSSTIT